MCWTFELASTLTDAPWENGITKQELIDYAERNCLSQIVIENLQELEEDELYYGIDDIWDDMPLSDEDFGWNADEH